MLGGYAQRMGLITTNSLRQTFNRRVVEAALTRGASLAFAVPDHPWACGPDNAAVRIAMTTLVNHAIDGRLMTVKSEIEGPNGEVVVELVQRVGNINADLTVGAAVNRAVALASAGRITSMGVMLAGSGFIVDQATAKQLTKTLPTSIAAHLIRDYRNGRDLTDSPRGVLVVDTFGLDESGLRHNAPAVYQYLLNHVQPERAANRDKAFRERWWLHGRGRPELRDVYKRQM